MLLWMIAAALGAVPQPGARLDLRSAYLVTVPGGRVGACDALTFMDGGHTLLAAGDDKVVHSWAVGAKSLNYEAPLRWNSFREQRGSIFAIAVSPDGRLVAVGGQGVQTSDVAVLARDQAGVIRHALTRSPASYVEATKEVWALSFDSTGKRVAIGHDDGSVWVWTLATNNAERVVAPPEPDARVTATSRVVWVRFTNQGVRYARRDGLVEEVTPGGQPRTIFRFARPINTAVASPDGASLAASPLNESRTGSTIEIGSLAGGPTRTISYPVPPAPAAVPFPERLAWSADSSRLAIGIRLIPQDRKFNHPPTGQVRVYDLTPRTPAPVAASAISAYPEAIAFHPDGNRIAIAYGHDGETALCRIDGDKLTLLDKSQGVGTSIWAVALSPDGSQFQFRTRIEPEPNSPNLRGNGDWLAFDLKTREWVVPVEIAVQERPQLGWKVEYDATSEKIWHVTSPAGRRHLIPLTITDDAPTCTTFLPPLTPNGPPRIAVGHYYGFSVFALDPTRGPQLLQRAVGHAGPVLCIDSTPDGKTVITGGRDQSIALWDLGVWPSHPSLGASFVKHQDGLTVQKVDDGSPAWEMGLTPGDVVTAVRYDTNPNVPQNQWVRMLAGVRPGKRLEIAVARGAASHIGFSTLPTRPVARFFPTTTNEWVLTRYQDGLYDASPNGDRFVGWLVSGATAKDSPKFSKVEQFRAALYKPAELAKFLAAPNRRAAQFAEIYPPPKVEVTASQAQVPAGGDVTVTITAVPTRNAAGNPQPIQKLDLWLDDQVLLETGPGVPVAGRADGAVQLSVKLTAAQLRQNLNRLVGVAHGMSRGEASVAVTLAAAPVDPNRKPELYALLVGVDRYEQINQPNLTGVADAKLMREAFEQLKARGDYSEVHFTTLFDKQATPTAILAKLAEVVKQAKPDDWLVVYLAGHGTADIDESTNKQNKPGTWRFIAYDSKSIEGAKLTAEQLFDPLNRANCHKLVLLDCCHAGAAEASARLSSRSLRPDDKGATVIAGSAADESAGTVAGLRVQRPGSFTPQKVGYFTAALFHGLWAKAAAADRDGDRTLTLDELSAFANQEVARLRLITGDAESRAKQQTVTLAPAPVSGGRFASAPVAEAEKKK